MSTGYCGNVHPGRTIEEVKSNLDLHALAVKAQVRPDQPMEIGLWLSATASQELHDERTLFGFRDWLAEKQLLPFTLNGFPFGDFHEEVVKHNVYRPTWADPERLEYTMQLAEIHSVIMPPGTDRTISTLPLGWPTEGSESNANDPSFWAACIRNLRTCADHLEEIEQRTGDPVSVCIEPEPGCILDTWDDIVGFFDRLDGSGNSTTDERLRNHIGVCHDICHSAVMFEEQSTAINEYARAGIRIGKVQVSSAVEVDFEIPVSDRAALLEQLARFAEPKYLHQTSVQTDQGMQFFEDLSDAIREYGATPTGLWRIHFHVPVFSESLGLIGTTQSQIKQCLQAIQASGETIPHFEIETYAWNVLPAHLQEPTLAAGIAKELEWFDHVRL